MQCVILAAGKGTRLRPLTDHCPKPLVKVSGKTLLDHIVLALPSAVDELIIVIGYKGEMIREYCGQLFHGRKVTYVEQVEQNGTAMALWLCKDLLHGRFLFMFADDIHGRQDIARVTSYSRAMLTMTSETPERFGVVVRNPDGTLAEMIEPQVQVKGEYYLTEVLERYAREYPVAVVEEQIWIPIGYPEDITKAETLLSVYKQI